MAWPGGTTSLTNLDQATDDPSAARVELHEAVGYLNTIIGARNQTDGICGLDGSAKIPDANIANTSRKVIVSTNDTTPAALLSKLAAGAAVTLTEQNDGGNETILISVAASIVGEVKMYFSKTPPTGWLNLNGNTIGNASSAADHAHADYEDLFTLLWGSLTDAESPMLTSAGAASSRGASAAADWAANKRLTMPDARGRVPVMYEDSATHITSGVAGIDSTKLGDVGGSEDHQLTVDELASHNHVSDISGATNRGTGPTAAGNYSAGTTTGSSGGDQPHNNTQPSIIVNMIIKY